MTIASMGQAGFINSEHAREMSIKANQVRWSNWRASRAASRNQLAATVQTITTIPAVIPTDPIVRKLARAIDQTLNKIIRCKVAKDRASLAQALRNLRETYHLITGEARPGQRKAGPQRQRSTYTAPEVMPSPEVLPPATAAADPTAPAAVVPSDADKPAL